MNKNLLRIGGAFNLLFVLFHLAMVSRIGAALPPLSSDIQATVSTWNMQVAFALLLFAYLDIVQWRALLNTRLGNITAIAIALFWFLRGLSQVVFYELTPADLPLFGLCLLLGLLHLIPAIREWKNVPSEAQHQAEQQVAAAHRSQVRTGMTRWPSYAAVAWCVLFGSLHLYWALGGTALLVEMSMPSNRVLALTRDPIYMGITWGVVIMCVIAALLALAPFEPWSRRLPRWILVTPLWIACGLFLLRGLGTLVHTVLVIGGGMPFDPLSSWPDPQAWARYMLIDAAIYSPWFTLGAIAFGATAWVAGRQGANRGRHTMASSIRADALR
jgi:hypothetical protein